MVQFCMKHETCVLLLESSTKQIIVLGTQFMVQFNMKHAEMGWASPIFRDKCFSDPNYFGCTRIKEINLFVLFV